MSLWGSFWGSDQRDDLAAGKAAGDKALQQGFDQGYGDYSTAAEAYDPYVESGTKSQSFHDDLMGLNGPEAQSQAYATLGSNPLFSGEVASGSNALLRTLNAQGASGGGKAQLAGARVLQETGGNWLDRYAQGGAQGFQATGAKSNALMGRGDLSYGFGATKAGNEVNFSNALAASRSTGINNLMRLGGVAVNALTPGKGGVSAAGNVLSAFG